MDLYGNTVLACFWMLFFVSLLVVGEVVGKVAVRWRKQRRKSRWGCAVPNRSPFWM